MLPLLPLLLLAQAAAPQAEAPKSWVDPDTGHRIVRLSTEPGSASMYFNQNRYLPDGKHMVYTTPKGIAVLNLDQLSSRQIVPAPARLIDAGRKHPRVYYSKEGAVWFSNILTGRLWCPCPARPPE
jgi:oligogalacturonide lyase